MGANGENGGIRGETRDDAFSAMFSDCLNISDCLNSVKAAFTSCTDCISKSLVPVEKRTAPPPPLPNDIPVAARSANLTSNYYSAEVNPQAVTAVFWWLASLVSDEEDASTLRSFAFKLARDLRARDDVDGGGGGDGDSGGGSGGGGGGGDEDEYVYDGFAMSDFYAGQRRQEQSDLSERLHGELRQALSSRRLPATPATATSEPPRDAPSSRRPEPIYAVPVGTEGQDEYENQTYYSSPPATRDDQERVRDSGTEEPFYCNTEPEYSQA